MNAGGRVAGGGGACMTAVTRCMTRGPNVADPQLRRRQTSAPSDSHPCTPELFLAA